MPNPGELLGGPAPGQPSIAYATVSSRKALPATFTDPLWVVMPYDPDRAIRIDNWPRIHGATVPAAGARVLLAFDEYHNVSCVYWDGVNS